MADGTREGGKLVPAEAGRLKAFVSYSRDDLDFADQLVAALELCGFEATIDRHGISGGEAWQQRLGALILEADTVVFVLSPSSARSDICSWEVEEAVRLGKRILPVLARPLDGASPPANLQDLNYVFFYAEPKSPGSGFGAGLTTLVAALNSDLGWIREHTRLLERATEWDAGGRPASRLLSGSDIVEAKAWAGRRPKGAPDPTPMHFEFIRASEEEEESRASTERKRLDEMAAAQDERAKALMAAEEALRARARARAIITWGSVAAAMVLAVVAGFAVALKLRADSAEAKARASEALSKASEEKAKESLFEVQITRSRLLLDSAKQQAEAGDQSTGILLTLEATLDPKRMTKQTDLRVEAQERLSDSISKLRERTLLTGHTGLVWAVAATPDGKRIVTGAWGNRPARVWDDEGKELFELHGHQQDVNGVALTPDGTRIVTVSDDSTARIWDANTREELHRLEGHADIVYGVAVTPDGVRVVTGSADKTARIWDAKTGKELSVLRGHKGIIYSVAVTADGSLVVTGSADKTARVWEANTGKELLVLNGHTDEINGVAFSPDGHRVITGSDDKTVRIWNVKTGDELLRLKGHDGPVWGVAVTLDGTRIVTSSVDKTVRIWDASTGEERHTFRGHTDAIRGLALTKDTVVTGSDDRTVRIWDTREGAIVLKGHHKRIWGVAVTPDPARVVTASSDKTAGVWDAKTGKLLRLLTGHTGVVYGVAVTMTRDGLRIVTCSADKTVRVWDGNTGEELLPPFKGHTNEINGVAFSPDGHRVITGSDDRTARIWDARTGKELRELKGHDRPVWGVAFAPDGTRVATGSEDKKVRIWEVGNPAQTPLVLEKHTGEVFAVAFTPDGTRVVSGSADRTVRIWDATTGAELLVLKGHTGGVYGVAVTPDGALIVTGSKDGTARIWDAKTGAEVNRLDKGHTDSVFGVAVSPDGAAVVTGSWDDTARIWDLARLRPQYSTSQDLVNRARSEVPRCLTINQRKQFALGPRPPDWCIEMAKYPYHTKAWSTKDAKDAAIARELDDFANSALSKADFPKALEAVELSTRFDPDNIMLRVNEAHALMFSGKRDEAKAIYLAHRGKVLSRRGEWETLIKGDFAKFKSKGLDHPLMAEIERLFLTSPIVEPVATSPKSQ